MEDDKVAAKTGIMGGLQGSSVCCTAAVGNAVPRVDVYNCREGE